MALLVGWTLRSCHWSVSENLSDGIRKSACPALATDFFFFWWHHQVQWMLGADSAQSLFILMVLVGDPVAFENDCIFVSERICQKESKQHFF